MLEQKVSYVEIGKRVGISKARGKQVKVVSNRVRPLLASVIANNVRTTLTDYQSLVRQKSDGPSGFFSDDFRWGIPLKIGDWATVEEIVIDSVPPSTN